MKSLINKLKDNVLLLVGYLRYLFHKYCVRSKKLLKVMSIEETLDYILEKKCSVIRFGDGEISYIRKRPLEQQEQNTDLRDRLIKALTIKKDNILICIPNVFKAGGGVSLLTKSAFWFQIRTLAIARSAWYRFCDRNQVYGNAFISRSYLMFKDRSNCAMLFKKFFEMWNDEDVILVEGEMSLNGWGLDSDMFSNVKSLKRILCPQVNAWRKYTKILDTVIKQDKSKLVLLAIGPTSKVLACDLIELGYRVIDIGNISLEYVHYKLGLTDPQNVPGRYFWEIDKNQIVNYRLSDDTFNQQVIAIISADN